MHVLLLYPICETHSITSTLDTPAAIDHSDNSIFVFKWSSSMAGGTAISES